MENISISEQNLIDRLEIYMETFKLNNNQVSSKAGLSNGLLGKARKNRSAMNSDSIEQILYAFPDLDADWLLTGRGKMLNGSSSFDNIEFQVELSNLKSKISELEKKNDDLLLQVGYWKAKAGVDLKTDEAI